MERKSTGDMNDNRAGILICKSPGSLIGKSPWTHR